MSGLFWTRKLTRGERCRMYLSWPWIRQTPPLYRLTMWWMNQRKRHERT